MKKTLTAQLKEANVKIRVLQAELRDQRVPAQAALLAKGTLQEYRDALDRIEHRLGPKGKRIVKDERETAARIIGFFYKSPYEGFVAGPDESQEHEP